MNYQGLMEITKIENIADDVYEMTLKGEGAKYISQPGQFINIKINESLQPYLRRPMSISDYDENTIVIVFKVVGQGTEILKNKQIGDQLDCLIGLGNGFTVQEGKALLIGGGLGTPPLYNLGKKLKEKGIDMLDAPVSGGEPKAIDGTVAFMVGGDEKTFDKNKQILTHMGSSVTRCGELGAGNTTKLANQIIVACNIQAVSESFILAKKAGVDPECVFEAIKGGLAGSTIMNAKVPMMIEDNVEPGFRVDLHIKDLNNALECAHSVGAPVPMTAQVQEIMQYLHNNGDGSSDHSAIIHYYEKLADTKL